MRASPGGQFVDVRNEEVVLPVHGVFTIPRGSMIGYIWTVQTVRRGR